MRLGRATREIPVVFPARVKHEVALVLAGRSDSSVELLTDVRHVHPRAKRALLVGFGDWGQKSVGDEIFEGVADGRFDH